MKKAFIAIAFFLTCLTANSQVTYEVTHISNSINTTGSESGAVVVDDSVLLYNTMQWQESNSRLYLVDFNPTLTTINQAHLGIDGTLGEGTQNQWGLNSNGTNCGNVAYDPRNGIIYFTRSSTKEPDIHHIYYTKRTYGRWGKPKPLGGNINLKGYSSTHPSVGYMPDGKTILYFSSDRPGGLGGMDIWYTMIISEGKPGNCTNLGTPVNSDSNDVTPFYCNEEGTLYFSSNRSGGQGGYDVYRSTGQRNSWRQPTNLGEELNSPHDDLFFTFQPCQCRCVKDTGETGRELEACGFLASNRPGSLFTTDSNCCNDLFRWRRLRIVDTLPQPIIEPTVTRPTDLLPISLYFHNDEPNPHTLDTTTTLDYSTTWHHYIQRIDEYKGAQSNPADWHKRDSVQKAVDHFFKYDLQRGYQAMNALLDHLIEDLKAGHEVTLVIDGFASPLFEDLYNINISKRRIDCFRNTLIRWNGQVLLPYLNNGKLKLETVAHGAADTNTVAPTDPRRDPRSVRSVYSLEAARDRRIDIVGYYVY
ncbi:MAG: PD40 domain-containing protein [Bacteroidales bacterium]|nr:PD40 domain-containing protein [Bacteroidales bacterium]